MVKIAMQIFHSVTFLNLLSQRSISVISRVSFFSFIIFIFSCERLDDNVDLEETKVETIDSAKEWFNSQSSSFSENTSKKRVSPFGRKEPNWENTIIDSKNYSGTLLEIPLKVEKDVRHNFHILSDTLDSKKVTPESLTKLLVYKDKDGIYSSKEVTLIPEDKINKGENLHSILKKFSGVQLFSDANENIVEGYRYKNGKIIEAMGKNPDRSNGRTEEYACRIVLVGYWQQVCMDGAGCSNWKYLYGDSYYICVLGGSPVPYPYRPGDPTTAGGGGTSSGGWYTPTNPEPAPLMYGISEGGKICGQIFFSMTGEAYTAKISGLLIDLRKYGSNPPLTIRANFPLSCITIPKYHLEDGRKVSITPGKASDVFLNAWNYSIDLVIAELNAKLLSPITAKVQSRLKALLQRELKYERPGSVFSTSECLGTPYPENAPHYTCN